LFRVNDASTRARGITNLGKIVGAVEDPDTGTLKGFVVTLASGSEFESVSVPSGKLLEMPGVDVIGTFPEDIDELGRIVGIWTDASGGIHGFLATPLREGVQN